MKLKNLAPAAQHVLFSWSEALPPASTKSTTVPGPPFRSGRAGAADRQGWRRPSSLAVGAMANASARDDLAQLFNDDLLGMDAGVGDAAAEEKAREALSHSMFCLLYTSPSPRD